MTLGCLSTTVTSANSNANVSCKRQTHWHDLRCSRFDEKEVMTCTLDVCLPKWIDGLGCQEVTVRKDGEPSICELIRRVRELRAEGTTTVDEISPPQRLERIRSMFYRQNRIVIWFRETVPQAL